MKKILLYLLFAILSVPSFSQTIITMVEENGVYKVPCVVNGLRMKFIFDTGASLVTISESMASLMYDNGYITDEDIMGKSQMQVADGRIVDNIYIRLKKIEIGDLALYDVDAFVVPSQESPLLLGQTAIQKLGSFTIDGSRLIINTTAASIDDDFKQTAKFLSLANEYESKGMYDSEALALSSYYNLMWKHSKPTNADYLKLGDTYFYASAYCSALSWYQKIDTASLRVEDHLTFYSRIGLCYGACNEDARNEIEMLLRAYEYVSDESLDMLPPLSYALSTAYYSIDSTYESYLYAIVAIRAHVQVNYPNITISQSSLDDFYQSLKQLYKIKNDEDLGDYIWQCGLINAVMLDFDHCKLCAELAASLGCQEAQLFLQRFNNKYNLN